MPVSLKYAVVERERRYLLARLPDGITTTREIVDRYVDGTRLRLREVREEDGTVTRKLGHKVRLSDGPAEVACTNLYLDDAEWAALAVLPDGGPRPRHQDLVRDLVAHVAGKIKVTPVIDLNQGAAVDAYEIPSPAQAGSAAGGIAASLLAASVPETRSAHPTATLPRDHRLARSPRGPLPRRQHRNPQSPRHYRGVTRAPSAVMTCSTTWDTS